MRMKRKPKKQTDAPLRVGRGYSYLTWSAWSNGRHGGPEATDGERGRNAEAGSDTMSLPAVPFDRADQVRYE
jgi:hypothetical protein